MGKEALSYFWSQLKEKLKYKADVDKVYSREELDKQFTEIQEELDLLASYEPPAEGTRNYNDLINKPMINGIVLSGDQSFADLGLEIQSDTLVDTKTGAELMNIGETFTGVVLCTEDAGEYKEGNIYMFSNGDMIRVIQLSGGGGAAFTNHSVTITDLESSVAVGSSMQLKFDFISDAPGKGTAKLLINGALKSTKTISAGENFFDITQYIKENTNYFTVVITDSVGSAVTFDYIVNGVKLTLKSSFNENNIYSGEVLLSYSVIGAGSKTIVFTLDGEEHGTATTSSSGETLRYTFTNLSHGVHTITVTASTTVGETLVTSNILTFNIIYTVEGETAAIIKSSFAQSTATEGELLNIDFMVYDPTVLSAPVQLLVNGEVKNNLNVDRTLQYWNISNYPAGEVTFTIKSGETVKDFILQVEALNIDITPVTDNLILYLTAEGRNNGELEGEREKWIYEDIEAQLTDFNWSSNGWIDGALRLTGKSKASIPVNVFETDGRSTGKTIEIELKTRSVSKMSSVLVSCFSGNVGFQVTSNNAFIKSEQQTVSIKFKEDEKIRIGFVIEPRDANKLIKVYLNGILSGVLQYDDLDNFQQTSPVGITINDGGEQFDIYSLRIYNMALSSRQILDNYIYDITDVSEKLLAYQANNVYDLYGNISMAKLKSMIPILCITGPLPPTKGEKQTVATTYTDPFNPDCNFEFDAVTIDIQGTSSQYYPKKNYKLKFPSKFSFYPGAVPEKTYTFKADYMESSHSHNTAHAKLINDLYTEENFPTVGAANPGVRNTIYGFPCAIYYRASADADYEYFGAYNFNNDKGNSDTLGLTSEKAESWEFRNNTSEHCLLRNGDFGPDSGAADNFEARYPKAYEKNPDYTALSRVVNWIISKENDVEGFKAEFTQYFNLYFCLIYYVIMDFALMIDSRAKNMFWDTDNGTIWYPRFYDMDTGFGLNNEGVLGFGYGLEQHDPDIYNGENSLFWNLFEQAYEQEIKDMYLSLRASGKLSYEAYVDYFYTNHIKLFCEAQFNADAQFKYINPLVEDGDATYLYTAQGSRVSHFRWWVANRLKYLDSKYETPQYTANYLTMRLYTTNGNYTITPYNDQYLKIKFGSTDVKVRAQEGVPTVVPAPAGLVFNDTETIIYGGDGIADLGDLSEKYAGTVDLKNGLKLGRLKLGDQKASYSNPHLKTLSLGNNTLLTDIDISNSPNLIGTLDISGCTKINNFYAAGTGLTGIVFPNGGDLTNIKMPTTLNSLIIKNHSKIASFTPYVYTNLQTLALKNTPLDFFYILFNNFGTISRLQGEFLESQNIAVDILAFDYLIKHKIGIDDNNNNTPNPVLKGKVKLLSDNKLKTTFTDSLKTELETIYPETMLQKEYATNNTSLFTGGVTTHKSGSNIRGYSATPNATNASITSKYNFYPTQETLQKQYNLTNSNNYNLDICYIKSVAYNDDSYLIIPNDTYNYIQIDVNTNTGYNKDVHYILTDPTAKIKLIGSTSRKGLRDHSKILFENADPRYLTVHSYYSSDRGNSYITSLDLTGWDTSTCVNFTSLLAEWSALQSVDVHTWDTSSMTNMSYLFEYCLALKELDLSNFNTAKVTNFQGMFKNTQGLKQLDLSNFDTSNATNMEEMFYQSYVEDLDISNFNTSKVTNISGMFSNCRNLKNLNEIIKVLDTSSVTDMSYLFSSAPETATELDLTHFNTEKVQNMDSMFYWSQKLQKIDMTGCKTPALTSTYRMFNYCTSLKELIIPDIDFSNVTSYTSMFDNVPRTCKIVTNQAAADWLAAHYSSYTNIEIV